MLLFLVISPGTACLCKYGSWWHSHLGVCVSAGPAGDCLHTLESSNRSCHTKLRLRGNIPLRYSSSWFTWEGNVWLFQVTWFVLVLTWSELKLSQVGKYLQGLPVILGNITSTHSCWQMKMSFRGSLCRSHLKTHLLHVTVIWRKTQLNPEEFCLFSTECKWTARGSLWMSYINNRGKAL